MWYYKKKPSLPRTKEQDERISGLIINNTHNITNNIQKQRGQNKMKKMVCGAQHLGNRKG